MKQPIKTMYNCAKHGVREFVHDLLLLKKLYRSHWLMDGGKQRITVTNSFKQSLRAIVYYKLLLLKVFSRGTKIGQIKKA